MSGEKFTVLTVDDARLIRRNVRNMLGDLKIRDILEAANGKEAIKILQSNNVNLIISDWNMPEMNGQQLLEWVRQNEETKSTPFIMLTAEADQDKVVDALKAGASNYIVKPFTAETLIKKLRQFLPKHLRKAQGFGRVMVDD